MGSKNRDLFRPKVGNWSGHGFLRDNLYLGPSRGNSHRVRHGMLVRDIDGSAGSGRGPLDKSSALYSYKGSKKEYTKGSKPILKFFFIITDTFQVLYTTFSFKVSL